MEGIWFWLRAEGKHNSPLQPGSWSCSLGFGLTLCHNSRPQTATRKPETRKQSNVSALLRISGLEKANRRVHYNLIWLWALRAKGRVGTAVARGQEGCSMESYGESVSIMFILRRKTLWMCLKPSIQTSTSSSASQIHLTFMRFILRANKILPSNPRSKATEEAKMSPHSSSAVPSHVDFKIRHLHWSCWDKSVSVDAVWSGRMSSTAHRRCN